LDTGFSHLLDVGRAPIDRLVHVFQAVTAGLAVLAVLGGCGIPINPPPRPVRGHPRFVVIRSLTGTWIGAVTSRDGSTTVAMTLRQTGSIVEGSIGVDGLVRRTDPSHPARIDSQGRLLLVFGDDGDRVYVRARIDHAVDRLYASIDGGGIDTPSISFGRR
jgi:hypothetical protein